MLTTGTVQLSLADVDKLRDTIKEKETAILTLQGNIEELKAKQREVIITEKGIDDLDSSFSIDTCAIITGIRGLLESRSRSLSGYVTTEITHHAESMIRRNIFSYHGKEIVKKTYYKNLDDVQAELRIKVEKENEELIQDLKSQIRTVEDRIGALKDTEASKRVDRDKMWQAAVDLKDLTIEEMKKRITELETGKREETEKERLKEDNDFLFYAYHKVLGELLDISKASWFKRISKKIDETITLKALRKAFEKHKAQRGQ